jgi:uncharacterized glyoxalase superfamily protein PhnB
MQRLIPMLCVADPAQAIEWYVSLGFTVQQRHPEEGEVEFAFLSQGEAKFMVQHVGRRKSNQVALWFYTDSLDEVLHHIVRLHPDVAILEAMYEPEYGGRQFSVADPDGLEVVSYEPPGA